MRSPASNIRLEKNALAFVDRQRHFDDHDHEWVEYWLSRPVEERLAAAQACRLRVDGPPGAIDRRALRLVSTHDDTDN
jgi:hypothetical protein